MISTKNITGGNGASSTPKIIQPGNITCEVLSVKLEPAKFKEGGYDVVLNLEGPNMGEEFEGFWIDKDDQSKGRHKGQVGKVRASEYPYAEGTTKTGIQISRDKELLRFLQNFCKETGSLAWLESQDNMHNTIESLFEALNNDKPFAAKQLRMCIAGKEYVNKDGYTNFDLFLPKYVKGNVPFESADVAEATSKVLSFDPEVHVRKKKVDVVASFGDAAPSESPFKSDFEL